MSQSIFECFEPLPIKRAAYYLVRRKIIDFYDFFRYDIHQGIRNLIIWFPIIWQDRSWDWDWLAKMMAFKLTLMVNGFEKYGHHVGNNKNVKRIRICANILKRLQADDYDPYIQGTKQMTRLSVARSSGQMKNEKELLFKLMEKHMMGWWD
jgi:hypothetical protein